MTRFLNHTLKSLLITAAVAISPFAHALDVVAYNDATFASAQAAGKPSVIMFHATWCPTCKLQDKSLDALKADPELKNVIVFKADFDTSVALKQAQKVRTQSTFVAFKGKEEVARSTADTQVDSIKAMFKKSL